MPPPLPLRLLTWNIRHGRGLDGRVDLQRVADVIAAHQPDVVTLQEVDSQRRRSGTVDQADELARLLGMEPRFAPCITNGDERYGIATLSRGAFVGTTQIALPRGAGSPRFSEPRCALVTRHAFAGREIDLVNTHLSLRPGERMVQIHALSRLGDGSDLVMAGDLNCTPTSVPYLSLLGHLRAVRLTAASWPSRWPMLLLDHVLYRGKLAVADAHVVSTRQARHASDHLPVLAAFSCTRGAA